MHRGFVCLCVSASISPESSPFSFVIFVARSFSGSVAILYVLPVSWMTSCVGFVAAAVSIPIGGCRARRPNDDISLVSAETVDVIVAAELAVL